ncbi:DUF2059 domain-containing protein [Tropicibacter sp. R16_0]|uniref:DUF2059 domain-containing protein n=1 Tax=Tropicibacter sp. R16_0 TaxID=2821102 RepID=UPI001AD98969|nr:DUF2059 domain-containing protein [Tropicibacter sp. R16_0]MBO9449727.1 DUF2059 domain-containing protein [Tropicibacter sp. R16_0]
MLHRAFLAVTAWVFLALPVWAESDLDRLARAMKLDEVAEILRAEGLRYGASIDDDMLAGQGGDHFARVISDIYQEDRIVSAIRAGMEVHLDDETLSDSVAFFSSDLGQTIISLENSARRAFADPTIEDAARERYEATSSDDRFLQQLETYIEANNLVEQNVDGALTADYNFYLGLAEGNGAPRDDQGMLATILEGREDIRADTQDWLYGFLMMAYSPLSEQQMDDNIAFSRTKAGIALNTALFEGFDDLYNRISFDLGLAVARALQATDL